MERKKEGEIERKKERKKDRSLNQDIETEAHSLMQCKRYEEIQDHYFIKIDNIDPELIKLPCYVCDEKDGCIALAARCIP